jgi:hypothetical protein
MTTRQDLLDAVALTKGNYHDAERVLAEFDALPENNVFPDLKSAENKVEDMCDSRAHEDCEGAGNCGNDTYTQDYMVDGVKYRCTATYEYNRHDKTYYYIEEREYSHEVLPA